MKKSVAIIGSGAMGCLFGSVLSKNNDVFLIDKWQEHIRKIQADGLIIEEDGQINYYSEIKAATSTKSLKTMDIVFYFVKGTDLKVAITENINILGPKTILVTLQNGIGNIETIQNLLPENILIAGSTSHGALVLGPARIQHSGTGNTIVGAVNAEHSNFAENIANMLRCGGIITDISTDIQSQIWSKLMINVGINAITAISEVENGKLLECPELLETMKLAIEEAEVVALAKGIRITENGFNNALEVCKKTASNKSSMLQDIENKRKTEIRSINGAIVDLANFYNIKAPINSSLTNLILWKEKRKNR